KSCVCVCLFVKISSPFSLLFAEPFFRRNAVAPTPPYFDIRLIRYADLHSIRHNLFELFRILRRNILRPIKSDFVMNDDLQRLPLASSALFSTLICTVSVITFSNSFASSDVISSGQ